VVPGHNSSIGFRIVLVCEMKISSEG